MRSHPIFSFSYCNSSPIHEPYIVEHHLHTTYFGCLFFPPPSFLPSSMSPNLLPPDLRPNYSRIITEQRSNRRNQLTHLMKRNRRGPRKGGNIRYLRNLSKVMNLRYKLKEVVLLHQTITPLLICLKTR